MKKILLSLLLIFSASTLFAKKTDVKVVKVEGRVKIIQGSVIKVPKPNQVLSSDITIKTYNNGSITVKMPNGKTRVISKNRTIAVSSLTGSGKSSSPLVMKLFKKKKTYSTPSAVAGVRGAEQGKSQFTPMFAGSNDTSDDVGGSLLEQARIMYNNEEYENCISKLKSFVNQSSDNEKKAEAYDMLSSAYIEMAQYKDAVDSAKLGVPLTDMGSLTSSLNYNAAMALSQDGQYKASISHIDRTLAEENNNEYFWKAQVLKVVNLTQLGNDKAAKKLKKKISADCKDQDVLELIGEL